MKSKKNNKLVKVLLTINVLLVLLVFTTMNAFADFYVIAGSRGVGTKITSLPYTISSSGFYFIAKDLTCAAGSHGITINADNVTLDLMGFSLVGPGGGSGSYNGINMIERENIEIRNGTVRNFSRYGINERESDGKGHRVINIRVKDNDSIGIMLSSQGNLVEKCTAVDNGDKGIMTGGKSTVTGNTCSYNGDDGIYTGEASTVTGNTCDNNGNRGIWNGGSSTVTGNTCYENGSHGIYTSDCSTVVGNTCRGNTGYGISLGGFDFVDQNTAYYNGEGNMTSCATCVFGNNLGAP